MYDPNIGNPLSFVRDECWSWTLTETITEAIRRRGERARSDLGVERSSRWRYGSHGDGESDELLSSLPFAFIFILLSWGGGWIERGARREPNERSFHRHTIRGLIHTHGRWIFQNPTSNGPHPPELFLLKTSSFIIFGHPLNATHTHTHMEHP